LDGRELTVFWKTIIANCSHNIALPALKKPDLTRCTCHTITDMSILERPFEEIRRLGYGVDLEESPNGVCCHTVPLRDHAGNMLDASTSQAASPVDRVGREAVPGPKTFSSILNFP
jgi:DNA-binding IclR family transcriptional regulator